MEQYEALELEVITFADFDVITSSKCWCDIAESVIVLPEVCINCVLE